jgi:hypothetical protein
MKNIIKKIIDTILIRKSQYRIVYESKQNILDLIYRLHPVKTNHKLIRFGPQGDGGYLLPDNLDNIEACFSPGVFEITKFEYDCHEKGIKLFLADKSISKPKIKIPENGYEFLLKFIGPTDNNDFITLDTWIKSSSVNTNSDLLLQMDIEGWEYLSIINVSNEILKRFRIIVIEFHNLHELWNPAFFNIANQTFSKLLESHSCVHIHPNNYTELHSFNGIEIPPLAEFTFYRNDNNAIPSFENTFPHLLDSKNVKENPDIHLPQIWYRSGYEKLFKS